MGSDASEGAAGTSERIEFEGASGARLAARFDAPSGKPRATALFAHCFTCGKDLVAAREIAGRLVARGFGVLRFDFTGLGSSEGEFANTDFSSNVGDLVAAAEHLASMTGGPRLLVGHSLGGAAALAAASQIDSARAVATIGAPADPVHVEQLIADEDLRSIEGSGVAEVTLAGRKFTVRREFLEDIRSQNLLAAISEMERALAVFHAPGDLLVGIENARQIFEAAQHPKSFISLDDADHLLSSRADAAYTGEVLAAWAGRFALARDEQ